MWEALGSISSIGKKKNLPEATLSSQNALPVPYHPGQDPVVSQDFLPVCPRI